MDKIYGAILLFAVGVMIGELAIIYGTLRTILVSMK